MIPRGANNDRSANFQMSQIAPIDYAKILSLFAKADKPEYEL